MHYVAKVNYLREKERVELRNDQSKHRGGSDKKKGK